MSAGLLQSYKMFINFWRR